MEDGIGYEYLPKAVVYICGQLALGLVVVRWLTGGGRDATPRSSSSERWLSRRAVAIATALLLALLVRVLLHTATAFGTDELWTNLHVVAIESRWGVRWQWQLYAAAMLVAGGWLTTRRPIGWWLFTLGALALALVTPLLGHAAGSPARHTLHALHLLAGAIWIGSLGVIALLTLSPGRAHGEHVAQAVRRFSPIALTTASLVWASGIVAVLLYLPSLSTLWSTAYGRLLVSKVALVSLVLFCGWRNWQRARLNHPPLRSIVVLEYLLALGVTIVTAALTETEHP